MKTYRQREKQGSKVQESTKGPDEAKIKVTFRRTLTILVAQRSDFGCTYLLGRCTHSGLERNMCMVVIQKRELV